MPFKSRTTGDENVDGAFFSYIDRYLRDFMNMVTGEPNYPFNIAAISPYDSKQLVKVFYRIPSYDPQAYRRVEVSFTVSLRYYANELCTLHYDLDREFERMVVSLRSWKSQEDGRTVILGISSWVHPDRLRRHSALDYLSPMDFE